MPCEFSLDHFKEILDVIKREYDPLLFSEYRAKGGRPRIFLRHDLDHSLRVAFILARLEAENGIKATYFIQLHSDLYSATSNAGMSMVREIAGMGHEIGFHYDADFYINAGMDVMEGLKRDIGVLGQLAAKPVVSISKHNPVDSSQIGDLEGLAKYNAYSEPFAGDLKYISDSNMAWREGCVCGFLARRAELQVLFHPLWWVCEGENIHEKALCCGKLETDNYTRDLIALADYYEQCLNNRKELDKKFGELSI